MKKARILLVLIIMALCLGACTSKKEEEKEVKPAYDIAGKTFYNTVDDYGHEDHSKVWLGKDGSFVLNDSYGDGYYEASGSWTMNENVVTLNVDKTGAGSFTKILFEIKNEETLCLKTNLEGSKSDNFFSIYEIKGSSVKPEEKKEEKKEEEKKEDKKEDNKGETSNEIKTEEVKCTGLTSLYKNYWAYEGVKNYDLEVMKIPADSTEPITFTSDDENVVTVDAYGYATAVKEGKTKIHIKCGSVERVVGFETRSKTLKAKAMTWRARRSDVADQFKPSIYLDGNGHFVFTENCYAKMGEYKGTYTRDDDDHYICKVTDASSMEGFAGDDVKEIVFKILDDKTLRLKTPLCMSEANDLFDLVD